MQILVVVGHPNPDSFNHAIAHTAVQTLESGGHSVTLRDLHAEQFDPYLPPAEIPENGAVDPAIQPYCDELARADGIIVVHPNWWGQPPAVLKGWIDRVFRPGVAYRFEDGDSGEGVPVGLLKAQAALVFNTSNTSPDREARVFGDPLDRIWRDCIFDLCGVKNFHRTTYCIICTSSLDQRQAWLADAAQTVAQIFPAEAS